MHVWGCKFTTQARARWLFANFSLTHKQAALSCLFGAVSYQSSKTPSPHTHTLHVLNKSDQRVPRPEQLTRGNKSIKEGKATNHIVLHCALVDMNAKCGVVSKARRVLDKLPSWDVVSWNALIVGYAQEGHTKQTLKFFEEMQHEGILLDALTYACILKACDMIRAGDNGKQIHDEIERQGLLQNNVVLGGALVDMYAKCGAVAEA
ncbi:hypothetical protein L7F22_065993 [Adiantum nelumboides]|nr:hypothetical protein [Adiantum nelumboides]